MRRFWLAGLLAVCGCLESSSTVCGDTVCASGAVCGPDGTTCTTQGQIEACAASADGDVCTAPAIGTGICVARLCVSPGCGNGFVEQGEVCDDGNQISGDSCRADCDSNEVCGDGIVEPALGELCDCGSTVVSSVCTGLNSDAPGAECRSDCTIARCGDGIADPGELCDDGNTRWDDGCRADCAGRFRRLPVADLREIRFITAGAPNWAMAVGGSVLMWDGTEWTALPPPLDDSTITGVWGIDAEHMYVSTAGGFYAWTGSGWEVAPRVGTTPMQSLRFFWGQTADDVWASNGAEVFRTSDAGWEDLDLLEDEPGKCGLGSVVGLRGTSPTNVVVLQVHGMCVWDGSSWTRYLPEGMGAFDASNIAFLADGTMYVSDRENNRTLHFSSSYDDLLIKDAARTVDVPGNDMRTFAGIEDRILMVGDLGAILEWVPATQTWINHVAETEKNLRYVSATSYGNVFIGGWNGTILH